MSEQLDQSKAVFASHGLDNNSAFGIKFIGEDGIGFDRIPESLRSHFGDGVPMGEYIFFGDDEARDDAMNYLQDNEGKIDGYFGHHAVDYDGCPVWADYASLSDLYIYICA